MKTNMNLKEKIKDEITNPVNWIGFSFFWWTIVLLIQFLLK